jgi:hypothetical protein
MNKRKGMMMLALVLIASAFLITPDTFSRHGGRGGGFRGGRGWGGGGWGWGGYGLGLGFGLGYGWPYYGGYYGYPYYGYPYGGYGLGYGLGYGIAADSYRRERDRDAEDRAYRMGRQDERAQKNRLDENKPRE